MIPRWAKTSITSSLDIFPITAVVGPRQAGKTTLCREIAKDRGMTYVSLDEERQLSYAFSDPTGFLEDHPRALIDEIQRAPQLILALKYSVDQDGKPGRYIITGSVDLFGRGGKAPDSLAGRMDLIKLLPLAQGEVRRLSPSSFLEDAFKGEFRRDRFELLTMKELLSLVLQGGYPKLYDGYGLRDLSRERWLQSHVNLLAERDLPDLAEVRKKAPFRSFINVLAENSATLVNLSHYAQSLELGASTIDRWLQWLEMMFLAERLPAWHKNVFRRPAKMPKLYFTDTGLLATLSNYRMEDYINDRPKLGALIETFVFSELTKLIHASPQYIQMSHYREKNRYEVDFVLELGPKVVGVEVKAAHTIFAHDFSALRRLRSVVGENFVCGIIFHRGSRVSKREGNLYSMPFNTLWL